jgi:hypothetical protein
VKPGTAIFSLPVYGKNIHEEQEVVVTRTAWKKWDAWLNKAPSFTAVPIAKRSLLFPSWAAQKSQTATAYPWAA